MIHPGNLTLPGTVGRGFGFFKIVAAPGGVAVYFKEGIVQWHMSSAYPAPKNLGAG